MLEKEYRFTLKKAFLHSKTIIIHKHWVSKYCRQCGIGWQGIIHDLSKFSPSEFFTNVKYTEKGISPVDVQKNKFGYSKSWMHHKGHNPHHYEYWMDKFDDGGYVCKMPYKYIVECLCDSLGANKAYNPKKSTYVREYNWWTKARKIRNMHPDDIRFLDNVFGLLAQIEDPGVLSDDTPELESIISFYNYFQPKRDQDIFNTLLIIYNAIKEESNFDSAIPLKKKNN